MSQSSAFVVPVGTTSNKERDSSPVRTSLPETFMRLVPEPFPETMPTMYGCYIRSHVILDLVFSSASVGGILTTTAYYSIYVDFDLA